ncbi:hypothetical protein BP5796_06639 [Coleophoma crateriformis]|uniref:Uncharacterized protein n=1 Tax=Coleophoma crateriformis TaxID=565419 RepID=A0A3D8RPE0_9HELO|nr:hypothetical protein BP5796_06639 [Coleophoma crateriformis]
MAPIRRYLRITKYSVLECRIYLDNPALAESWLLNPRNPILPRVIESVRPLVLPKLREENARARNKGGKKKGVKDVVVEDDFEVSIFLTETNTRHTLLTKQKHFRDKGRETLKSNSQKLMGATNDVPIHVEDIPELQREESDENVAILQDIPALSDDEDGLFIPESDRTKRPRAIDTAESPSELDFEPLPKRRREDALDNEDDKKKMAMDTTYDGFSIYGRVLCLVVKRKDTSKSKGPAMTAGQAMMEDWITSTQIPPQEDE